MKISIKIYQIVLLLVLPQLSNGQGNLVVNGGFNNISNGTNVIGWALTGNCYPDSKYGSPTPSLQLFGTAGADQTVNSLTPGTVYIVSGDYQTDASFIVNFKITVDGKALFEIVDLGSANSNWQSFNFSYTATSSSAVLGIFLSEGSSDALFHVDNISIYAVPEPSAWSLILLGGGVFLYVRARKHHSA